MNIGRKNMHRQVIIRRKNMHYCLDIRRKNMHTLRYAAEESV